MARPKQPYCPKCLKSSPPKYSLKERASGYCTEHRQAYQRSRQAGWKADREIRDLLGDNYDPPSDAESVLASAEEMRQAESQSFTVDDLVREIIPAVIPIIEGHFRALHTELAATISRIVTDRLRDLKQSVEPKAPEQVGTDRPTYQEIMDDADRWIEKRQARPIPPDDGEGFEMPDAFEARRGRLGPPS